MRKKKLPILAAFLSIFGRRKKPFSYLMRNLELEIRGEFRQDNFVYNVNTYTF